MEQIMEMEGADQAAGEKSRGAASLNVIREERPAE